MAEDAKHIDFNIVEARSAISTLRTGLVTGLKTTWALGKVIFPITVALVVLQHTPVLPWVIEQIAPFMGLFGLSGEAAVPLVLGNALNLYAAIAGILSLELTVKEVFILAVMLSFSHNMFIETGVALKVGVKLWVVLLVRFGLAALSGILINLVWQGGGEVAVYGLTPAVQVSPTTWGGIILLGLEKAAWGVIQLAAIVIPLMIAIQYMKDRQHLERLSRRMLPVMKVLGIHPNASMTLLTGLAVGLVYGAGVMIRAVKDDGVSRKDATLTFLFLMACHAVIEDTLLFVPLGIPVWPLLVIRLVVAVVLTIVMALTWKRAEETPRTVPTAVSEI